VLISRLLAWAPEERFNGQARQAAEALEEVAHRARSPAARSLFVWGYEQNPCVRSPEAAQLAAQWGAESRQTLEQREAEKVRAATALKTRRRSACAPAWATAGVAALLVLVLMLVTERQPPGEPQTGARLGSREHRSVSVGDSAMSPGFSMPAPEPQGESMPRLARPLLQRASPAHLKPAGVKNPLGRGQRVHERGRCPEDPCSGTHQSSGERPLLPAADQRRCSMSSTR
jgi:hypothetical protein